MCKLVLRPVQKLVMRQFTITSHFVAIAQQASCSRLCISSTEPLCLQSMQIWLLVTVICSEILNLIFVGPGLQTINRQKLLAKRGLKGRTTEFLWGRTDNSFFSRHKQLTRKVAKCTNVAGDYIEKRHCG